MSHLIIKNIDTVYTPEGKFASTWHGLETVVSGLIATDGNNIPDVFCPVTECGIKPTIELENEGENAAEIADAMKDWKLIVADCRTGKARKYIPLHVPRKGYAIHQNKALFDCMIKAAQQVLGNAFEIVTVGTLGGYTQFFVSIAIKGESSFSVGNLANGVEDKFETFFNLNSSHNGLIGSNRMLSAVRIVCMNTVQMSIQDADANGTLSVIKHTLNSADLITPENFAADLSIWVNQKNAFQNALVAMKDTGMSLDQFRAFSAGVFTNETTDTLSTTSLNRINDLCEMFSRGIGNEGKTAYDAANAWTQYFTHGKGTGDGGRVEKNKRVASANFGRANDWKQEAIRVLVNPEVLAKTIERGSILYQDKLISDAAK